MSAAHLAAFVAFAAFGANFIGTALLLLFNPRSRGVRWYAVFNVMVMGWLVMQGLYMLGPLTAAQWTAYGMFVHMMPGLFLAGTLAETLPETRAGSVPGPRARTHALLPYVPVVLGVLLLVIVGEPLQDARMLAWQVIGWGGGAALYVWRAARGRHRGSRRRTATRSDRTLEFILSGLVPVGVVGAIAAEGGFIMYVLPLMTIAIQLLIFVGVVHHRYYDIEVRAARTGELAAGAAEQDRLALLGELAATIAHEVRNPLTGIRSLTQLIAESPVDDARRQRYTDVILGEITRLDRIVGNLTDLARRSAASGSAAAAPTPLGPLLEDLVMLVEPRARRTRVDVVAARSDLVVHASREALAQALLNLLLNAVAVAPPGSAVEISAAGDAGVVIISVRDHGPGIPADQRVRIFEPFHTTGGTGLGLAVVRRLAEEHGWTVAVTDADGGGALFTIALPQAS